MELIHRGHFCGVAQMTSAVDYNQTSTVWAQDKWKGIFKLRWIFVKDIPNGYARIVFETGCRADIAMLPLGTALCDISDS
jgi:hypothetical protein